MAIPDPAYRNSAGRLLAVFSVIPQNQQMLESIPNAFGLPNGNLEEKQQSCVVGWAELHKLYLEFVFEVNESAANEQQRRVILEGLAALRESIYPTQMIATFRVPTPAEKALLEVAATIIPQEAPLEKDDVVEIRESVAHLRTLVEDAEITPALRKVLLELIRLSEDAISRFNIHGARGLRKAFKAMLGETAEAFGSARTPAEQEGLKLSPVWTAMIRHVTLFDNVASKLLKYQPLIVAQRSSYSADRRRSDLRMARQNGRRHCKGSAEGVEVDKVQITGGK